MLRSAPPSPKAADGAVYVAWADFAFIAERYPLVDQPPVLPGAEVAHRVADCPTCQLTTRIITAFADSADCSTPCKESRPARN